SATLKHGAAAVDRIAFPLLAMLLLIAVRALLARWHTTNLLDVAIPLVGALGGVRFAVYLIRVVFKEAGWVGYFERVIVTIVWIAVALHITGLLPDIVEWLSGIEFSAGKQKIQLWTVITAAFWVVIALLIALWIGSALEARLMAAHTLDSSLRAVFARLGKSVLVVVAVLIVLPLLGIDLTVLSVFGGALGVGLGLGLQKIASNYVSGFIILLDRSIRLSDVITADHQHGVVTRIKTRYVVVRSPNGVESIIPNDILVTTTVVNHSYTDKKVRIPLKVQVAYNTQIEQAVQVLSEIALRQPRVLRDPAPTVHVINLADNGIELELGVWLADQDQGTQDVRSGINLAILNEFRACGIEIPFPQREVRLLQQPPANGKRE
ncbi:MAG TPA: mechanosensitive ion channel domain-containing protein, partial [Burkholderiales bacterium]|nr:mechanosensitive ion channel domain-containing protein [Burkholderiales bacterium]